MRSANSPSRSAFPPFIGSVLSLLVATLGLQCSCGGRGSSGSGGANPPAPPPPELPAEIKQQMPHSRDGLPLLSFVNWDGDHYIGIAYDAKLDDPLARWASCLGRVGACYETNSGPVAGCIDNFRFPVCATDAGGKHCCPPACVRAFKQQLSTGVDEDTAIDRSFVNGDCVAGLAQELRRVQP